MIDRSWMLNPQAIRHAKQCIQIINERKKVKLKLSQADFFQQLEDSSRQIRSVELLAAYHQLMAMADTSSSATVDGNAANSRAVKKHTIYAAARPVDSVETIAHKGKHYPKWQAGKAFRGLLGGQPQYI